MGFKYTPTDTLEIADFPAVLPSSRTITYEVNTKRNQSPLTQSISYVTYPGHVWRVKLEWSYLTYEEAMKLRVFWMSPGSEYFYYSVQSRDDEPASIESEPQPNPIGGPDIVNFSTRLASVNEKARFISLANIQPGTLKKGRFISFDDNDGWRVMHKIIQVEESEGNSANLQIEPPLTADVPIGARAHVVNPSAIFQFIDGEQLRLTQKIGHWTCSAELESVANPNIVFNPPFDESYAGS